MELLDADVVIVGDFRFPGGTSTAIASEISALAKAGYRVALVALCTTFLSKTRSFNPAISSEIAAGNAILASPHQAVRAPLACLHHPALFEVLPSRPLNLVVEQAVLVVHHPPVDAAGKAQYDIPAIRTVLDTIIAARVVWAPVGPKVRQQFHGLASAPPLTREDWVNVIDPARFGGARAGLISGLPVVGRHSRPDPLKWPDTPADMRAAYPDDPEIRVRLMGFAQGSVPDLETIPGNWEIQAFNAETAERFLKGIDFFSYFHGSDWIEAFGRSIIEAMASGLVCFLPKDFEPLFKEGAVYCKPADVTEQVHRFLTAPEDYAKQSKAAVEMVQERFSPAVAIARVQDRIGPPSKTLETPEFSQATKPRILYFTSNGIGMGHLTRVLACARRHRESAEPVVVSMSRAYGIARREGIMSEYLPFFRSSGMDEQTWHRTLREELTEIFRFYRPDVVVLDGNVPYRGLLEACNVFPQIWTVWLRRAMWPPGVGAHFLEHHSAFDVAIEPGEFAGTLDRGLTVERRADSRRVAPMTYLHEDEALERGAARAVLGLDPDRPAVFLQLGSGNNMQLSGLREAVFEKLATDIQGETPQIVVGEWQIGTDRPTLPDHVIALRSFPFARFLNAFDYAVALAGYNTFHENLRAGLPTLFLGNEHPEQDEQWLRADFAQLRGCALTARSGNIYDIMQRIFELTDPKVQKRLRSACRRLQRANGADETAQFLNELAHSRKPHPVQDAP